MPGRGAIPSQPPSQTPPVSPPSAPTPSTTQEDWMKAESLTNEQTSEIERKEMPIEMWSRETLVLALAEALYRAQRWQWKFESFTDFHNDLCETVWADDEERIRVRVSATRFPTTNGMVAALALRDGWTCHYCAAALGWGHESVTHPEIEHKTPKSRGGSDDLENLVLACRPCNRTKATQSHDEFCTACDSRR